MPEQAAIQTTHADPVFADFELLRSAVFYPLGYPLRIETNSREVIAAACESWSDFSQRSDDPPIRLLLGVSESAAPLPNRPRFRSRDHLMSIISDPENFVICDFNEAFAFGWVTPATVSNRAFLRLRFLESATMMMIQQRYLAAMHGALVQLDGCGVLLCGDTLVGKSTLSYACARSGWTFIGDDGAFLIRDREDRYGIGNPHTLRFREDAKSLFPELEDWHAAERPNGKIGLEVFTKRLPGIATADGCVIDHVVFLNRNEAGPKLVRFETEAALRWFEQFSCYGSQEARDLQRNAYRRLLGASIWELRYRDLDAAVGRLERLVRTEA
jgi:hypothetical protein